MACEVELEMKSITIGCNSGRTSDVLHVRYFDDRDCAVTVTDSSVASSMLLSRADAKKLAELLLLWVDN